MNRANRGANTNIQHILLDSFVIVVFWLIDILTIGRILDQYDYRGFFLLSISFATYFILAKKSNLLYDNTTFCYKDRFFKRITKSFVIATLITTPLMFFVADEKNRFIICYVPFISAVYISEITRLFFNLPILRLISRRNILRTAFIGRSFEYNKFFGFLKKTTIFIENVGFITVHSEELENARMENPDVNYLGSLENIENLIKENHIDQIYIFRQDKDDFIKPYIETCLRMGITVRRIDQPAEKSEMSAYVSTVGTYPIVTFHTVSLNNYSEHLKRVLDIVCSLLAIIITSPIMLLCALGIKIDSPGPVIFKQVRVGKNGRRFTMYKFRSMRLDAEEEKQKLMEENEMEGGVMFKMKDDPRVTKFGKFLRKTSLDEFPQFFNVLMGTMSLVGIRPPTEDEVSKYDAVQWRRLSIKPGITGMWQVSGRSNVTGFDEVVRYDTEYIDDWSLWLDIKIIFRTVKVLFSGKGAY